MYYHYGSSAYVCSNSVLVHHDVRILSTTGRYSEMWWSRMCFWKPFFSAWNMLCKSFCDSWPVEEIIQYRNKVGPYEVRCMEDGWGRCTQKTGALLQLCSTSAPAVTLLCKNTCFALIYFLLSWQRLGIWSSYLPDWLYGSNELAG